MSEFLAEAQVKIVPNTALFRAELEAQLRAVTAKPVVIPVTAAVAAGTAQAAQQAAQASGAQAVAATQTAAATNAAAKAQQAGAAAAKQATSATAAYAHALDLNAVAANRLAGIEEAMSLTTTELAASRVRLQATTAAAATSEKALQAAISTGNVAFVQRQVALTAVITGTRQLAVADVQAAIAEHQLEAAQRKRASAQAFAGRGAGATALSLLGVRGATLAANSAFLAGAAGAIVFTKAVGSAADLETQLNVFEATAEATADQMERVSEAAQDARRRYHLAGCRRTGRRRSDDDSREGRIVGRGRDVRGEGHVAVGDGRRDRERRGRADHRLRAQCVRPRGHRGRPCRRPFDRGGERVAGVDHGDGRFASAGGSGHEPRRHLSGGHGGAAVAAREERHPGLGRGNVAADGDHPPHQPDREGPHRDQQAESRPARFAGGAAAGHLRAVRAGNAEI